MSVTCLQEESLRRDHGARVEELRKRLEVERDAASRELEDSHRGYEKLRCEKRLLEDKYRSLKEKYLRLYTDVKVSIEKRKRRDVGSAASGHRYVSAAPRASPWSGRQRQLCLRQALQLIAVSSRKTDLGAALDNVNVLHPAAAPGDDDDDDAAHSRSSGGGATAGTDARRRPRDVAALRNWPPFSFQPKAATVVGAAASLRRPTTTTTQPRRKTTTAPTPWRTCGGSCGRWRTWRSSSRRRR